ncbi:hypothetical protein C5688_03345 [Methylocystis sp. MitZ-2018]|nr:hypothetical protein C5688_03345 [Methylocystis sp. MitZ-2018]
MAGPKWLGPPTRNAGSDPRECRKLAAVDNSENCTSRLNLKELPSRAVDERSLQFDFFAELGEQLVVAGAPLTAAAAEPSLKTKQRVRSRAIACAKGRRHG